VPAAQQNSTKCPIVSSTGVGKTHAGLERENLSVRIRPIPVNWPPATCLISTARQARFTEAS
jgi:hypothetical protein